MTDPRAALEALESALGDELCDRLDRIPLVAVHQMRDDSLRLAWVRLNAARELAYRRELPAIITWADKMEMQRADA